MTSHYQLKTQTVKSGIYIYNSIANKLHNGRLGSFNNQLDQTTQHFRSAAGQQYINHLNLKQKYLTQAKTRGRPSYQYSFLICSNNTKLLKPTLYLQENARPMTFNAKALETTNVHPLTQMMGNIFIHMCQFTKPITYWS